MVFNENMPLSKNVTSIKDPKNNKAFMQSLLKLLVLQDANTFMAKSNFHIFEEDFYWW